MTSPLCFQGGGALSEAALSAATSHHNAKKREKEEKGEQKAAKCQKAIDEAKALLEMEKGSSAHAVSELKALIQHKK